MNHNPQENASFVYDYAIVGAGLSGLQLANQLLTDPFFKSKSIVIIDKSSKSENDKTWCFWEQGNGNWKHLVHHSWSETEFKSSSKTIDMTLSPYSYKMIRAIDFYSDIKAKVNTNENITWLNKEVSGITSNNTTNHAVINCGEHSIKAAHVFDSRLPQSFLSDTKSIKLKQHFKGVFIETEDISFSHNNFTIMDFTVKHGKSSSFMYVLPLSKNKALIEFTFFNLNLVNDSVYDNAIEDYILNVLNIKNYKTLEVEKGIIPMTDFNFNSDNTKFITKIGTAGGWVKPSTGYSFKRTETFVKRIVTQLKENKTIDPPASKWRYRLYDRIFLNVLANENNKGEWIFTKFYSKNSIQMVFNYLDEQTTIFQDLKIMLSLFSISFIKAFFRVLFR
ncbi:MAG: hypothetical protein BM564_05950 [Bacteroidetes bacterium MedPE-SWsnd-G2]|nr:MAG: hypothetical protein BM564_05950 [Bacteroidetes bacterium MedPE-SWsnd-G2]